MPRLASQRPVLKVSTVQAKPRKIQSALLMQKVKSVPARRNQEKWAFLVSGVVSKVQQQDCVLFSSKKDCYHSHPSRIGRCQDLSSHYLDSQNYAHTVTGNLNFMQRLRLPENTHFCKNKTHHHPVLNISHKKWNALHANFGWERAFCERGLALIGNFLAIFWAALQQMSI